MTPRRRLLFALAGVWGAGLSLAFVSGQKLVLWQPFVQLFGGAWERPNWVAWGGFAV